MKNIIIIVAAALISNSIIAQDSSSDMDNREKFQFGLKAGLNYSNVYDAEGEEFKADPKLGLAGGVFFAIPIGKYLGIQPEILYSQKGFQGSGSLLGFNYEFKRTTSYIDIPLLVALKPSEFITIVAGPSYSYLINQKDEFKSSLTSYLQEQEFKNDNIRKNIFGVTGGIDINLGHITIGARVGGDLQTNNGDGSSSTPRYKNMWYQGTIGYKIFN